MRLMIDGYGFVLGRIEMLKNKYFSDSRIRLRHVKLNSCIGINI